MKKEYNTAKMEIIRVNDVIATSGQTIPNPYGDNPITNG